jgi:hypothetical protein
MLPPGQKVQTLFRISRERVFLIPAVSCYEAGKQSVDNTIRPTEQPNILRLPDPEPTEMPRKSARFHTNVSWRNPFVGVSEERVEDMCLLV